MNNRLQQFISAENLTQAQFADEIGVARASVSHILAGRNKPGFDFLVSTASHFPDLNLEWLINGKGRMYKSVAQESVLFNPAQIEDPKRNSQEEATLFPEEQTWNEPAKEENNHDGIIDEAPAASHKISKVIIFYDDNTFLELK